MSSRFIHVATNGRISFFSKAEWYSILCIYHIFFIHSFINGHSGCFHISAANSAGINMGTQIISFEILISIRLDVDPEVGLLDHMVILFSIFWGTSIQFFIAAAPINNVQEFPFPLSESKLVIFLFSDNSHPKWYAAVNSLQFWAAGLVMLSIFSYIHWPRVCFLWGNVSSRFCAFLIKLSGFLLLSCRSL